MLMLLIIVLWRLGQKDHLEMEASLGYKVFLANLDFKVRYGPAWATE